MYRSIGTRILSVALFIGAAMACVQEARSLPSDYASLAIFGLLVFLCGLLDSERSGYLAGLESAVIIPAVLLDGRPAFALLPLPALLAARLVLRMGGQRRFGWSDLSDASARSLVYYGAAISVELLTGLQQAPVTRIAALGLILVTATVIEFAIRFARGVLEAPTGSRGLMAQIGQWVGVQVLLIPIMVIEVVGTIKQGVAGTLLAFLPVLLVARVVARERRGEQENRQLMQRNRELSLLRDGTASLLAAEGEEATFQKLVDMLTSILPLKAAAAVTWESFGARPYSVFRFGDCRPTDQSIIRWVSGSGLRSGHSGPFEVFTGRGRQFPLANEDTCQIVMPIQTVEAVYGVFIYETSEMILEDDEILGLVRLVVDQAGIAIRDNLLKKEMQQKTDEAENYAATLKTVLDVSRSLISNHDDTTILRQIALAVRSSLGFDIVILALHDAARKHFVRKAQAGLDDIWDEVQRKEVPEEDITQFFKPEFRVSNSFRVPGERLWEAESDIFVRTTEAGLRLEGEGTSEMILVPMLDEQILLGYMSVRRPKDGRPVTDDSVQALEIFASQAAAALVSASHYQQIRKLTQMDVLTRAFNHRYFQETLLREVKRHTRSGRAFGVAMIDIDHFKVVNDTYGHPAGDEMLKSIVEEILGSVREIDTVARYGGEEFAVIFPEIQAESLAVVVERVRHRIGERMFRVPNVAEPLRVTISTGIALFPSGGTTAAALIQSADEALYRAKNRGRNRVEMATSVS
ncbi:MAG: sensor domain-containing diguanylate cyclase [Acidobacteriota bacterium]